MQDASKWGGELLHCDFAEAHAAISEVPSPFRFRMRQLLGRASAQCWHLQARYFVSVRVPVCSYLSTICTGLCITYPACIFATSDLPGECRTATVGGWELSWTLWLLWMLERRDVITVTAVGFATTHRWSMICQKRTLGWIFNGKKQENAEKLKVVEDDQHLALFGTICNLRLGVCTMAFFRNPCAKRHGSLVSLLSSQERCFFCSDCNICRGMGCSLRSPQAQRQSCRCGGRGFVHKSSVLAEAFHF